MKEELLLQDSLSPGCHYHASGVKNVLITIQN